VLVMFRVRNAQIEICMKVSATPVAASGGCGRNRTHHLLAHILSPAHNYVSATRRTCYLNHCCFLRQVNGGEFLRSYQALFFLKNFPNILWNLKFCRHVHNNPVLVPIPVRINPVHTTPSYFYKTNFSLILLFTSGSQWCRYFCLCDQNTTCIFSPYATGLAHPVVRGLIIYIYFKQEYKL
jgi:hypothetical protein